MSDRGRGQPSGCPLQQMWDRVRLGSGPLRLPESPPHPSPFPSLACSPYALVAREQKDREAWVPVLPTLPGGRGQGGAPRPSP